MVGAADGGRAVGAHGEDRAHAVAVLGAAAGELLHFVADELLLEVVAFAADVVELGLQLSDVVVLFGEDSLLGLKPTVDLAGGKGSRSCDDRAAGG